MASLQEGSKGSKVIELFEKASDPALSEDDQFGIILRFNPLSFIPGNEDISLYYLDMFNTFMDETRDWTINGTPEAEDFFFIYVFERHNGVFDNTKYTKFAWSDVLGDNADQYNALKKIIS